MDRSKRVQGQHPFHTADSLYGERNYDIGSLSRKQREYLLRRRLLRQRENELYLKNHPEIKAFIGILLRYLLRNLPEENVKEVVGAFFNRSRYQIVTDLKKYLQEMGQPVSLTETFEGKDSEEETTKMTTDANNTSSNSDEESIQRYCIPHF
ncbi:hypothetical protein M0802_003584 [Mischocyttarus mexicanus]|nr:hypothetical protein M0802_003584 [Mischocyttarus mexicanus]